MDKQMIYSCLPVKKFSDASFYNIRCFSCECNFMILINPKRKIRNTKQEREGENPKKEQKKGKEIDAEHSLELCFWICFEFRAFLLGFVSDFIFSCLSVFSTGLRG